MTEKEITPEILNVLRSMDLFRGKGVEDLTEWLGPAPFDEGAECALRQFQPGERIVIEGGFGNSFFILLYGSAGVFLGPEARRVATVKQGDFVGEMTLISGLPRSATITALEPCLCIEVPRRPFELWMKNPGPFRDLMDRAYMERGLASHLQSIPGFASIDVQLLREIAKRAKLKVFAKDETIVNEGAAADGLYLIREGFVRVVKAMSGGEARTVAYLNDGAYFGETAMLRAERCSATVIAMGKVEVIHIMKEDFFTLVNRDRNMAQLFAGANAAENPDLSRTQVRTAMGFVGEVVAKGVVKATSALVIHLDACTRCGNCVKACAELHDGISRLTRHGMLLEVPALKASMQPERLLVATSCMHCLDPECMIGCPTGAINRDINGEVVIEDSCIGCGNCARRCPYGNISMAEVSSEHELEKQRGGAPAIGAYLKLWRTPEGEKMMHEAESENRKAVVRRIAVKCDLCQDYNYNHGCVYNCPYSAIERMDPSRNLEQLRDRD